MTLREIQHAVGSDPAPVLCFFGLPVLLALGAGLFRGRSVPLGGLLRYLYGVLVYWVCIPGMLVAVLLGYQVFFRRGDLLDLELLVYGVPLGSMGLTILLIRWKAELAEIPGFGRLSGLMLMLGASFVVALVVEKTRIFLVFGSSILTFLFLAAGTFLLLRWGFQRAVGRGADGDLERILAQARRGGTRGEGGVGGEGGEGRGGPPQ